MCKLAVRSLFTLRGSDSSPLDFPGAEEALWVSFGREQKKKRKERKQNTAFLMLRDKVDGYPSALSPGKMKEIIPAHE
jgi:hypothetical protein